MKSILKSFVPSFILALSSSLLATSANAAPDDFGRLFSRPAERKSLDVLRQNQKLKVITPQDIAQPEEVDTDVSVELPAPISLQGFVKRSDGASTLWINNKAVQEGSAIDHVQIGRLQGQKSNADAGSDSLNVRIPANGKQVRLKAGQVYMPEINQIREMKLVEKTKRLTFEESGVIDNIELNVNNAINKTE